jgi:hypothetical protein
VMERLNNLPIGILIDMENWGLTFLAPILQ